MNRFRWTGTRRDRPGVRGLLIAVAVLLGTSAVAVGPSLLLRDPVAAAAGTPGQNDYPYQNAVDCSAEFGEYSWCINGSDISPMGFAYRNCTDFVAWRVGLTYASFIKSGDGNAVGWKAAAQSDGYTISTTPIPGSIAWWGSEVGGGLGHVAVVVSTNANGTANVEEYNYAGTGQYDQRSNVTADDYLYVGVSRESGLTITTASLPEGGVGVNYSLQLAASGGSGGYSWSSAGGSLPSGLTMTANGVIAGTPESSGTWSFAPEVTDSSGNKDATWFTLSVLPGWNVLLNASGDASGDTSGWVIDPVNGGNVNLWAYNNGTARQTNYYIETNTSTNGGSIYQDVNMPLYTGQSYTFSVWVRAKGTAQVCAALWGWGSGSPENQGNPCVTVGSSWTQISSEFDVPGDASYSTLRAQLYEYTTNVNIDIDGATLAAGDRTIQPTAIVTRTLPKATAGTKYRRTLAATGGTSPYSWSVSSGSLPQGLTLSSAGRISGTPTSAGRFVFTVTAADSSAPQLTATATYTIAVELGVSPSSLPQAQVGAPYDATLVGTGGTSPYRWKILTGSLPTGLSLSSQGLIAGTPTAAGSFTFTIKLTDSAKPSHTVTKQFVIDVS